MRTLLILHDIYGNNNLAGYQGSIQVRAEAKEGEGMKNTAFEGYQKQAVEDILHRSISASEFILARSKADKLSANSMQQRIQLIASSVR